MSLIIAKRIDGQIHIISETKITDPSNDLNKPFSDRIKSVIIDKNHCLSYAGNVSAADQLMSEILKRPNWETNELVMYLRIRTQDIPDIHLLLACCGSSLQIFKIASGNAYDADDSAWIGDIQAFSLFQEHYSSANPVRFGFDRPEQAEAMYLRDKFSDAFQETVLAAKINSIGNYIISVSSKRDGEGFIYNSIAMSIAGIVPHEILDTTEEQRLLVLRGPQSGDYSLTTLTPIEAGKAQLGIYILQGRIGVLFDLKVTFDRIIFKDISFNDFLDECSRREVHLSGMRFQ